MYLYPLFSPLNSFYYALFTLYTYLEQAYIKLPLLHLIREI